MKLIRGRAEGEQYGGWIKPNDYVDEEKAIVRSTDQEDVKWAEEVAPEYVFQSTRMEAIFRDLGRTPLSPHPAVVQLWPEAPKCVHKLRCSEIVLSVRY